MVAWETTSKASEYSGEVWTRIFVAIGSACIILAVLYEVVIQFPKTAGELPGRQAYVETIGKAYQILPRLEVYPVARFYQPRSRIQTIQITGTNGK